MGFNRFQVGRLRPLGHPTEGILPYGVPVLPNSPQGSSYSLLPSLPSPPLSWGFLFPHCPRLVYFPLSPLCLMSRTSLASISALLLLAACTGTTGRFTVESPDASSSSSSSVTASSAAPQITPNVSYVGLVEPAGISIYMQGSHRLVLADGRFVLLESTTVDLDAAVGKRVEVFGGVRPTVEAGGIIMSVDRVTVLEASSASSMPSEASSIAAGTSVTSVATSSRPIVSSAAAVSVASVKPVVSSSPAATPTPSSVSTAAAGSSISEPSTMAMSTEMSERVAAMASEDLSAGRWTQQYCSSHIGFCIPVHKNWWFKSFGATATALWHVEISNAPIDVIGSGPIVLSVRSGTVEGRKAVDGQVRIQGDLAIGFRNWTENRYVEISAPKSLENIVRAMTERLAAYAGA